MKHGVTCFGEGSNRKQDLETRAKTMPQRCNLSSARVDWHFQKKMIWLTSKKLHFTDIASCTQKRYFPEAQKIYQTNRCSVVRIGTTTGSLWLRFSVSSQTQRWCKRGSWPWGCGIRSEPNLEIIAESSHASKWKAQSCLPAKLHLWVIWDIWIRGKKRSVFQVIVAWPCSCFDFLRPNLWLRFLRCFKIRCQSPSTWIQRSHCEYLWVEVPGGCNRFGWFGSLWSVRSVKKCGLWPVKVVVGEVRKVWRIKKRVRQNCCKWILVHLDDMHQSPVFARFNHNLSPRPILGIDSAQKRNHGSRKGPMYVRFIKKEAISYKFIFLFCIDLQTCKVSSWK